MGRFYDRLIVALAIVAGVMMGAMPLLIAYEVLLRNIGLKPPIWAVPVNEFALLYCTVFAAPWLVRRKGHVFVEALIGRLSTASRRRIEIVVGTCCALLCLVLAYYAARLAYTGIVAGDAEVRSFRMPTWLLYGPMALGFLLAATEFLRLLWRRESYYDTRPEERTSA